MVTGVSADKVTNLSNLLPTGTVLTFQTLAPIFSNNGQCGPTEQVMTAILISVFVMLCFLLNFVDSVTTQSGRVYYGLVTKHGLFNPQFKSADIAEDLRRGDDYFTGGDDIGDAYKIHFSDYLNGLLDVVAFCTLSGLTPPITTCYYPGIPGTVTKTAPILVAIIVSLFFAFCPSGRHGAGFAVTTSGFGLVPGPRTSSPNQINQRA